MMRMRSMDFYVASSGAGFQRRAVNPCVGGLLIVFWGGFRAGIGFIFEPYPRRGAHCPSLCPFLSLAALEIFLKSRGQAGFACVTWISRHDGIPVPFRPDTAWVIAAVLRGAEPI